MKLIKEDKNLESKENQVLNDCCVVCSNRNCVRAANTNNYELMKNCINDYNHISSILNPFSISSDNSIKISLKNKDKKMIEMIFDSLSNKNNTSLLNINHRCHIEEPKIQLVNTGENSVYMVGVRTRKLNQTRGNKMGNDALIKDDIQYSESNLANDIALYLMENCDDPNFIDYIKTLQFNNNNNYMNTNFISNISFENYIINAVLKGNIITAKHFLKGINTLSNYGFNALHYQVLGEENIDNINIKVRTSLTKKPQTNNGMTPMHVACINPNVAFLKKLVELGGDWNVLDDLNRKPIHYAACCKESGPLNYLISLGAIIDEVDKEKKSALMYACTSGSLECVKALIRKNANIFLKDKLLKNTAFHFACKNGYKDIIQYFLENTEIKIDFPGEERMTGLMLACLYGYYDLVEFLVDNKAKVTKKDKFKRTALIHAIRGGHLKIVSYLLTKGSEYEQTDNSSNSPLHYACAYGFKEIAEELLKAGAGPNPLNDWNYTPLEIGFVKNHFGIIKFLLNYVDINTKFNLDMCLIHYSFKKITEKNIEEMKYLIIEKKCDINVQDYYGDSVLHYFSKYDYGEFKRINYYNSYMNDSFYKEEYKKQIIKIFEILKQGQNLDINLVNKQGKTAFQLALEKNNFYFIEELLKLNPNLGIIDYDGNSLMHFFAKIVYNNDIELYKKVMTKIMKIYWDKKYDINLMNKQGKTAFQIAIEYRNIYFIEEILKYNPKLCFLDKNGNSIFHCLIPLIFSDNMPQNNNKIIINQIIDRLKQNLTEEELNKINNTYDENGLTPLLKIMYQYNNDIYNIYSNIKSKEIYNKKKEKYNLNKQNSNLMNIEGNISYNENYYINNIILTLEEMNEVNNISLKKLDEFIEFILSIIKKFIDLKMNPLLKVGKILFYRNNPIKVENNTNLTNNDVINLSKKTQIEKQYLNSHAKNNILLYLMKYPSKILLKYFIEELKFPINSYNLYKYNSIFILFDNINVINQFKNVNVTVKDTLKYLIQQGINVNQTDYLGNNPFLYLSKKNFNIELLKILSENKCDINKFNIDDENSLFFYVRKRNLQIVRTLIEEFKVNYNLLDSKKRTIIHYLCNDEISTADMDEKFCDYLLTKKINLNQADILGRTPIHYLFVKLENEYNNNDIDPVITLTKILGYKEVDREHKDIYGNTPLHYACQRGSIISIITLGGKKIDYDIKNKENNSPLAYSFLFKKENIAISLIQLNVNLNQSAYPLMNRNEKLYYQQKSEIDLDYNQEDELINNIDNKKEETKNELHNKMDIEEIQNINNKIHNKNINIEKNIYLNNFNNNSNFYIKSKYNNIYNNYLNDDNENNINNNNIDNCVPNYITDLFLMEKSVELFRICIRNNFQALPHVFIARGYDLMKAVEDCFNEKKFKLAIKLLNRSPYNETYQTLNNEGQNLFHILSKIVINNSLELSEILNILYSKEIPLDLQDIYGNTPLHYAAKNLAQYLISFIILKFKDKKDILNIRNNDNNTPFMLAIKTNSINNMTYTFLIIYSIQKILMN